MRFPPLILLPMALVACGERQEPRGAATPATGAPIATTAPEEPPPPPAPPRPGEPLPAHKTYYESRYGVTRAEGERRQANEQHIGELNRRLNERQPFGFSSLRLQHEPYGVVIAFKEVPDRAAILALAHPSIRDDIGFERAKRSAREIERDGDRVLAALKDAPPGWSGGYDVYSQKFVFTFGSQAGVNWAEPRVPPDLRDDVVLKIGPAPAPLER